MNTPDKIQQGDVLLRRIDSIPENTGEKKVLSRGKLVLAEGEVTGHYHGIEESESELIQLGEKILLDLKKDSVLTHQEHHHITVPAGIYEIGRVQEYDYFSKMVRRVVD